MGAELRNRWHPLANGTTFKKPLKQAGRNRWQPPRQPFRGAWSEGVPNGFLKSRQRATSGTKPRSLGVFFAFDRFQARSSACTVAVGRV